MTKRLGLTPAMRRALHAFPVVSGDMFRRLLYLGLIEDPVEPFVRRHAGYCVSPRGRAALAAEPMTQKQIDVLAAIETGGAIRPGDTAAICEKWWQWGVGGRRQLTPAGRTQLHNIRAAMPGEWSPL